MTALVLDDTAEMRWDSVPHRRIALNRLLGHAQKGELNPAYLATHRFSLEDAPRGYEMFKHRTEGCVRAVFAP